MKRYIKKIVLALAVISVVCLTIGFSIASSNNAALRNTFHNGLSVNIGTIDKNNQGSLSFNVNSTNKDLETYTVNQEKSAALNDVTDITVNVPVGAINFIPESRNDVSTNFHGSIVAQKGYVLPELIIDKSCSAINIDVKDKSNGAMTTSNNVILDIHLPQDYPENITVTTNAGDISVNKFNLQKLSCTTAVGNIQVNSLKLSKLSLRANTGDIKGSGIQSTETTFNATTGSVRLDSITGDLNGKITTGDVNITYSNFHNSVDITASTGSIKLGLPNDAEFYLKAKASIGNVSSDFPVPVKSSVTGKEMEGTIKSDANKINLSVSTGNISIY